MNLDFLKTVTAKVEGRTAVVIAGLAFCGFCIWIFATHPLGIVSTVFLAAAFALACVIVLIPLLGKPQPSEPTPKFLIQQVGNQTFYTGGHHSTDELINLLREARSIQPLPPPSALVFGSPKDSSQYKSLSPAEAEELQQKDEMGVRELLRSEIERMRATICSAQLSGGPAQDTSTLVIESSKPLRDLGDAAPQAPPQATIKDLSPGTGSKTGEST